MSDKPVSDKTVNDPVNFNEFDFEVNQDATMSLNSGHTNFEVDINNHCSSTISLIDDEKENIFDQIQNNEELKNFLDPKNNSVTKKYLGFGMDIKRATSLSFMFTIFIWCYMSNYSFEKSDKKVDFNFK